VPVLLVIDDETLMLDCFRDIFAEAGTTVLTAGSAAEGVELFTRARPDAVVLDVRLPDASGLDVFRRLRELDARVPVILLTAHGSAGTAIEAMRLGAFEYAVKPLDPEAVRGLVGRAFEISRLMRVPARLAEEGEEGGDSDLLVGNCPSMREVYKAVGRAAPKDVTVLVLGESGTGKELVARAIYHYSGRAAKPFLAINCAAIPEALLESELFGHEKGSFTGADRRRIGKFEQCDGGTLFLDEIGDMTPLTQTKILRVLQDGQFERVGGNETLRADVRVVAATNRDLGKLIEAGQFRQDLYYRLNVYTIRLPPLRERAEDLPALVGHFLKRIAGELGKEVRGVTPEAMARLERHPWPGNVRELQSALKQAILQATGPYVFPENLPATVSDSAAGEFPPGDQADLPELTRFIRSRLRDGCGHLHAEFLARTERHLLLEVLRHTEGNLSQASRILGINRATLRSKLASLRISVEHFTSVEGEGAG
jgi:two-component system, NtrC family, nitrogen regulation response regulator GlnG